MQEHLQSAMPRAYVAAMRWLRDPDESRDACQEAATKAWAARARFDTSRPFYPWFYRIVRNVCFDRLRVRPRETALDRDVAGEDRGAESDLMAAQRDMAVRQAVAALPEAMAEIIELRHFQDLSYEEIGLILEIAPGTVMSRLYRARKALGEALRQHPAMNFGGRDD